MKCDNCKKHDDCATGSGLVWPCGAYVPKVITNAERIRAMSDDDLCELLMGDPPCDRIVCPHREGLFECRKCVFNWLQQPAEGG